MEKEQPIVVTFRLPRTLHAQFKQYAYDRGLKLSFAVSAAIAQYISAEKNP